MKSLLALALSLSVSSIASAHTITNIQSPSSSGLPCWIVSALGGGHFSLPTATNPLNPDAGEVNDANLLQGAAVSYQGYTANPQWLPAPILVFWDLGPADPSCHGYTQILNVRVQ